jgi:3-dehydroquinate synthase
MRLATPAGFPTEVMLIERPEADLLPAGPWALVGDAAVREAWRKAQMPEPEGTLWVRVPEAQKRLETILPWLESWAERPLYRDATIVAVGGGVITDLAGLAASLYMRGIAWQSWPSTLLSQVDAGLGGKTGADLHAGKNLVGAFHAPKRLVACTSFLESLPPREVESGRWELVKTALLQGDLLWAEELLGGGAPKAVWIERALAFKAGVTHRDPTEQNERRLLNLGHTLGHAIESASGYCLLHGESVGFGLLAACLLAEQEGLTPFPESFLTHLVTRLAPLSTHVRPWSQLLPWLLRDKKGGGGTLKCVLPRPGAPAVIHPLAPEAWEGPLGRMMERFSLVSPRV